MLVVSDGAEGREVNLTNKTEILAKEIAEIFINNYWTHAYRAAEVRTRVHAAMEALVREAAQVASEWTAHTYPEHEPVDWETHQAVTNGIGPNIAGAILEHFGLLGEKKA